MYEEVVKLLNYHKDIPRFVKEELSYDLSKPQKEFFHKFQDLKPVKLLVSAGRGCGKCVTGDALIETELGLEKAEGVKGREVVSLDGLKKITEKSRFNDDIYEVITRHGFRLKASSRHLIFSRCEKEETYPYLELSVEGLPTDLELGNNGREIKEQLRNIKTNTSNLQEFDFHRVSDLKEDEQVLLGFGLHHFGKLEFGSPDFWEFLGLITFFCSTADRKQVTVGYRDKLLRLRAEELAKRLMNHVWIQKNPRYWRFSITKLRDSFEKVGFQFEKVKDKTIPRDVFRCKEELVRAFLRGAAYISELVEGNLKVSHKSEKLLRGLAYLVNSIGFFSEVVRGRTVYLKIERGEEFLDYVYGESPRPEPFCCVDDIIEIRKSKGKVYSFEVEHPHHYLANNFLSHNSFSAAIAATWSSVIYPYVRGKPYKTMVLGGSERQARKVYRYMLDFLRQSQFVGSFVQGEPLRVYTRLKNGSEIFVRPCSETAVRGEHVDLLIIDEAASAKNEIIRGALPAIDEADFPRILLLSTPHNPSSLFVTIYHDYNSWGFEKPVIWKSEDCFWKNPKEMQIKKKALSKREFEREYQGIPISMEENIIDLKSFQKCRVATTEVKTKCEKAIGVDWGFAPPENITVICVVQLDRAKDCYEVVKHKTLHGGPRQISDSIVRTARDFDLKTIHADSSHKSENQRLREKGVTVREVVFQRRLQGMIQRLQRLIERGKLRIPERDTKLMTQIATYRWKEKRTGHVTPDKNIPVDYIDSLHCALEGFRQKFAVFQFASGKYGK